MSNQHVENKKDVHYKLMELCAATDLDSAAASIYADDAICNAFHPVNGLSGRDSIVENLWRPVRDALPDVERHDSILIAGEYKGNDIVSMMGHYQGTFSNALFDIPATHENVQLRYCEVHEIVDGRISQSYVLVDLLDLMRQAGCWPIAPSLGAEGKWPDPATSNGVRPDIVDSDAGAVAHEIVKQMHAGLLSFDGKHIESMNHETYWTNDFMWYGPSGIGTTRGLDGFRAHHQFPFLRAFPDRGLVEHIVSIGDGSFVVTGGWPSLQATHTGGGWLGLAATGKRIGMRVMDFYRTENGLIAENWVPIDILDVFRQLGVDVLERVKHRNGFPRMAL
ncbi:MAG: ester cyclase [Gammaproteobacteria bacterium]|nr:ester cyclase [Gammaproteobacteria bacterium]